MNTTQVMNTGTIEMLLSYVGPGTVHQMQRLSGLLAIPDGFGRVFAWLWRSDQQDRAVLLAADLLSAVRASQLDPQPSWREFLTLVRLSLPMDDPERSSAVDYVDRNVTGYYATAKEDPAA